MNLTLTRTEYRSDGIFSELRDEDGNTIARTLEHAYLMGGTGPGEGYTYIPKIPPGTYTCVRGPHRLHGMTADFETFEITGVVGHENLLFHWGNFNKDSEGCVLVGKSEAVGGGAHMVTASRDTFAAFMQLQDGLDSFQLTVA